MPNDLFLALAIVQSVADSATRGSRSVPAPGGPWGTWPGRAGPVGPAGPDGAAPPAVAGGAQMDGARRYGDSRLTNWLASFWANAWPNTE